MAARDPVGTLDASQTIVYRRLNRLEETGLVESRMTYDADGHHRKAFRAAFETATVTLRDGLGVDVSLRTPESVSPESGDECERRRESVSGRRV